MGTIETGSGGQGGLNKLNMIGVTENFGKNLNGVLSCLSQEDIPIYLEYLTDPESSINDVITAIQTLKSDQNGYEQLKEFIFSDELINKLISCITNSNNSSENVVTAIRTLQALKSGTLKSDQNGYEQLKEFIFSDELINKLISYIKNSSNSIENMITAIQTLKSDTNGEKELEKYLKEFFGLKDDVKLDLDNLETEREEIRKEIEELPTLKTELDNNQKERDNTMNSKYKYEGDKKFSCIDFDKLINWYDDEISELEKKIKRREDLKKGKTLKKIEDNIKLLKDSIANYEAKSQLLCELFFLEKLRLEEKKDKDQEAYNHLADKFIIDFKNSQCKNLDIISKWAEDPKTKDFKDKYEKILKALGWEYFGEYQRKIDNIKNEIKKDKKLDFVILPDSGKDNLDEADKKEINGIYEKIFAGTIERIFDVGNIENTPVNSIKQCNDFAGIKKYMEKHEVNRDTTKFIELFGGKLGLGFNYGFWTQQEQNWPINSNKALEKRRFDAIKTFLLIEGTDTTIEEKKIEKYILRKVFFTGKEYASVDDKKEIAKHYLKDEGSNLQIIDMKDFKLNDFINEFYEEINTIFREGKKPDIMDILKLAVKNARESTDGEKLLNVLTTPFCTVKDTPFKYYLDLEKINIDGIEKLGKGKFIEFNKDNFINFISQYTNSNEGKNIYTFLLGIIGKSFENENKRKKRILEQCNYKPGTNGEKIRLSGKARLIIKYKDGKAYIRHYVSPEEHGEDGDGEIYVQRLNAKYGIKQGQKIV